MARFSPRGRAYVPRTSAWRARAYDGVFVDFLEGI